MSTTTARSAIEPRSISPFLLGFLLAAVPLAAAGDKAPARAELTPKALLSAQAPGSAEGPQFLQADRKGRLFLFRPGSLDVVPLLPDGRLGKPTPQRSLGDDRQPLGPRGAMSGSGDWIVRSGSKVRLFRGGKEEALLDPEWLVWSVAWMGDEPVINVDPIRSVRGPAPKGDPPLVLRWTGRAWETLMSEALPSEGADPYEMALRQARAVELLGDSRGTLWMANRNRYLLRRYSAAGRLRLTLKVGKGEVHQRQDAEAAQKAFARQAGKAAADSERKVSAQSATALPVTDAMAEGGDGNLYLLVHHSWQGGDFALDRYDPVRSVLERTPVRLKDVGVLSLAAGKDGLYLAAFSAERGRWKLAWEDLEGADWKPVEGVTIRENDDTP